MSLVSPSAGVKEATTQKIEFDEASHTYRLDGRVIDPTVTQALNEVLPQYKADEFYLGRGRAVHAAAALIARGAQFTIDDRIAGQVAACRRFFAEIPVHVRAIEQRVYHPVHLYAGTLDLLAEIDGNLTVVDYKSTLTPHVAIQTAAYALCCKPQPRYGLGVELREDGTYRLSERYDLRRHSNEWLAVLTVYRIRQRLGIVRKEGETE